MRTPISLFLSAVLLAGSAASVFAQSSAINGQIEGAITDPNGASIPNAEVAVRNTGTGFQRSGKTDEVGFFRFVLLPLGSYEVSVTGAGFAAARRDSVVVNAGTTATVNIQLGLASANASIEVTSGASLVEPGRTDLGFTLGSNQIANLPLISRNTYNYILVQPNVSGNPQNTFGVPRKVNANGFSDRINYQLDGSNNTQGDRAGIRLMPISNTFLGEIQQIDNGFAPEFGNTVGTVFNAVTKSGTNDFHVESAYIFRRQEFNARPTLLAPTAPKPAGFLDSAYVNAGGHIIKDKLFIFGAFERVSHDLSTPVTVTPTNLAALGLPPSYGNPVPTEEKPQFYFVRSDWQINSNNMLAVRYNYFRNEQPYNNAGSLTVQSQSVLFHDRAHAGAVQLISTLSANAVNEFRFQFPYRDQANLLFSASGPGPALVVSGVANFGGPTVAGTDFIEETPEWADNFSYNRGTHSFKVGGDLRNIRDQNTQAAYAQYTFPTIAAYLAAVNGSNPLSYSSFTQTFGVPKIVYQSLFTGLFAQDSWKARPNLTLVYGLRYDLYKIPGADSKATYEPSRDSRVDHNNFAPRLGVSWALGRRQKTVVRVNGGIFYDAPQTDVYRRALLNNGTPSFFSISTPPSAAFAPAFPTVFTAAPTGPVLDITGVSSSFRTMYASNANVQISREITSNLGVSVSYLYTKGTGIPVYRNINLIPNGNTLADGRPIFGTGHVDTRFNNILVAESVGNSNYNGLNVTLKRKFSHGFDFFLSYTLSHSIDDAPEENVLDSGALLIEDSTNRRRDRGNSLSDRRHVVTASGVLNPQFQVHSRALNQLVNHHQLSMIFSGRTGEIANMASNRTLNGDSTVPTSLQRPLFVGRDTLTGPAIYQIDMRYSREIPLGERLRVDLLAEGNDVFNHPNITAINSTATVDTTGQILTAPSLAPTTALDSRLIQFGFRVRF